MVKRIYLAISVLSLTIIGLVAPLWPGVLYFLIIVTPFVTIGLFDITSSQNIRRNYPVIGHLRYLFEFIRPEIQQYFVATNLSGRPYNRELRSLIYRRAKNVSDTHPFGTEHDITDPSYLFAHHSMKVKEVSAEHGRILFGGHACAQPYLASLINISAMSYGSLSPRAVEALNRGAKLANIFHNTGEGGISPYHLAGGGDLVWQIGTANFGCRHLNGEFNSELFAEKASLDVVKMIEIKLSQGAKPSHGGMLPKEKITPEIAEIRGIPLHQDCLSPPHNPSVSTPRELLKFITQLRELSGGKPIGFKICIGIKSEFMAICKAMLETGIYPDFITVDGAEGGTGAAPLVYSNRLGTPINEALAFVHNCLVGCRLRDHIRLIASGKVVTSFDIACKFALGANTVNIARGFMFTVGCIQALTCNTNKCPTGVTSTEPARYKGIVVPKKATYVHNFHRNTLEALLEFTGALGIEDPQDIHPDLIHYRVNDGQAMSLKSLYNFIEPGALLEKTIPEAYQSHWQASSAERF